MVLGHFLGEQPVSSGLFAGISTLAVVAAMNDTNGGLYMALMGQYGKSEDVGAYTIMSLESGPVPHDGDARRRGPLRLSVARRSSAASCRSLLGMLLGNLDREMRDFLAGRVPVMIPFFAFALGASLDLHKSGRRACSASGWASRWWS